MAGRVAQVEEHLPRKDEALSSNHDVTKKKKKKKNRTKEKRIPVKEIIKNNHNHVPIWKYLSVSNKRSINLNSSLK
jgi:hypothetical protein